MQLPEAIGQVKCALTTAHANILLVVKIFWLPMLNTSWNHVCLHGLTVQFHVYLSLCPSGPQCMCRAKEISEALSTDAGPFFKLSLKCLPSPSWFKQFDIMLVLFITYKCIAIGEDGITTSVSPAMLHSVAVIETFVQPPSTTLCWDQPVLFVVCAAL